MKRIRDLFCRIYPRYSYICVLALLVVQFIAYYVPMLLSPYRQHQVISTALDDALPLVPPFIFIYVLAFVQWIVSYSIILRDSRERCFRFASAEMTGKFLAMTILLLWPTTMIRPAVEIRDVSSWLLSFIYSVDNPTNLFPSLHCMESWFCFRCSLGLKRMPRWYAWAQGVFTGLVFASVLLVKQHIWPDILGGVAVAELGLLISRLLRTDRLLERISKRLLKC